MVDLTVFRILLLTFTIFGITYGQKQEKFIDYDGFDQQQQTLIDDDLTFDVKSQRTTARPKKNRDEKEDNILAASEDGAHEPGSPYKYEYGVDNSNGTQFSQKVDSDGEVVTGEYRVLLPDGRTQIVTYTADWKNGFRPKYRYEGTIRPYVPPPVKRVTPKRPSPDEEETDIQPGGFTPAPTRRTTTTTRAPVRRTTTTTRRPVKRPSPDEEETDIQPGGFTPAPTRRTTTTTRRPVKRPGPFEEETDIQPGGFTPAPTRRTTTTTRAPVRRTTTTTRPPVRQITTTTRRPVKRPGPFEEETDIQPGGFTPAPTRRTTQVQNQAVFITPKPVDPCARGTTKSVIDPSCRVKDAKAKCIAEKKDPKLCFPELCFPGSSLPKCQTKPSSPDESETDIQPGGYLPKARPKPVDPCARGSTKALLDPKCLMAQSKAKCVAEKKDPKLCFPELCFPGSRHRKCQVKPTSPDEEETDIQPGGFTPAPTPAKKPSNLYDTPDTPYGVRLHLHCEERLELEPDDTGGGDGRLNNYNRRFLCIVR